MTVKISKEEPQAIESVALSVTCDTSIVNRLEQLLKAPFPIDCKDSGKMIEEREEQPEKP